MQLKSQLYHRRARSSSSSGAGSAPAYAYSYGSTYLSSGAALLAEFRLGKFQDFPAEHRAWRDTVEAHKPPFNAAELAAFCQGQLDFTPVAAELVKQSGVTPRRLIGCVVPGDVLDYVPGLLLPDAKLLFNAFHVAPSSGLINVCGFICFEQFSSEQPLICVGQVPALHRIPPPHRLPTSPWRPTRPSTVRSILSQTCSHLHQLRSRRW